MTSARRTARFTAFGILALRIVTTAIVCMSAVSCAGSRSLTFPTAHSLPDRSASSTTPVIDRPTAYPQAQTSRTDDLVLLTPPIAPADALRVVRLLFDAIVTEDVKAIAKLITNDAEHQVDAGNSTVLLEEWQRRFGNEDYTRFDLTELYVESEVKVFRYDDLKDGKNSENGKCKHLCAQVMRPSDLLVIVSIRQPSFSNTRVFGDIVILVLHGEEGGSRIKVMQEVTRD